MNCHNCGKEVKEEYTVCPYCETPLKKEIITKEDIFIEDGWLSSFNGFSYIPAIISGLIGLVFVVLSLIACATGNDAGLGIGCGILFLGVIVCLLTYSILKMIIAPVVLQTKCLLKIVHKLDEQTVKKENEN